jgi:hypothetical protein
MRLDCPDRLRNSSAEADLVQVVPRHLRAKKDPGSV